VAVNSAPGRWDITVRWTGALSAGVKEMVKLDAVVPVTAPYGSKHIIELTNVQLNGGALAARGDSGLHLVGFSGDTSGNAACGTIDSQLASKVVAARLAGASQIGFAAYPNVDPTVVADVDANGVLNALDTTLILKEAAWYTTGNAAYNRPEIPPVPKGTTPIIFSGPDPKVTIPASLTATEGGTVTVPINIEPATGLEAAEIRLAYDPHVLRVKSIDRGSVTSAFDAFVSGENNGIIRIDTSSLQPLGEVATGTLAEIVFEVVGVPATGSSVLDLQWVSLNDGHMVLTPLPVVGADEADGQIAIAAAAEQSQQINPLFTWVPARLATKAAANGQEMSLIHMDEAPPSVGISRPATAKGGGYSGWVKKFVDHASQSRVVKGPNAGIRVNLPVASQTTGALAAGK